MPKKSGVFIYNKGEGEPLLTIVTPTGVIDARITARHSFAKADPTKMPATPYDEIESLLGNGFKRMRLKL